MESNNTNVNTNAKDEDSVEMKILARTVLAVVEEQRRTRIWGNFFKLLLAIYFFLLLYLYLAADSLDPASLTKKDGYTALIEIEGVIASEEMANADAVVTALRKAFKDKKTKGIILRINSPGGSPVQAGYINDEIKRLKKEYPDIPVYAVITDICASGGYYIAVAADKIYADKASMVGSIGVLMNGFGYVETMEKLGVERRLYTAGENKGFLDPFSPEKLSEINHVETLLKNIHEQFVAVVKEGRGDKLNADADLFNGFVWTGEQAKDLGLVDQLGSSSYVAREVIGAEEMEDFTVRETFLDRFAKKMGASAAQTLAEMAGFSLTPQLK